MQWFPLYPSDFIGATVGLSCQEVSTYSWMLILYYELGPFPVQSIRTYRIVRCESDEQKRTVDFILSQFFVLREDGWYQERAEAERVKQARLHDIAVERGKRSASARVTKFGTAQPGRVANPEKAFESVSKAFGKEPELTTTTKEKKIHAKTLPKSFSISEEIRQWAKAEKLESILQANFDYFVSYAKSTGKKYADWDAAFQNCVRGNWAKAKPTSQERPVWEGAVNL